MSKNIAYRQACVLNEVTKLHTMQEIAKGLAEILDKKSDIDVSIYETSDDGFVLRKKKDGTVTDNEIVSGIRKVIKEMIDDTDDFEEIISDQYDFEYDKSLITDSYLSDVINIRRSGRLVHIELDL